MAHGRATFIVIELLQVEARDERAHLPVQQEIFHVGRAHAAASDVNDDVIQLWRDRAKLYPRQVRKKKSMNLAVQACLDKTLVAGELDNDRMHVLSGATKLA